MALGVALVFPYMLLGSGGSVRHIDLDSSPEFLKSVFFGGDPWQAPPPTPFCAPTLSHPPRNATEGEI